MYPNQNCGSGLAREGGLTADQSLADVHQSKLWELACSRRRPDSRPISRRCTPFTCGSEPAREGGLTADQSLAGVHIHFCGNGHLRFRPDGESLFQTPKRNQKASPQASGTSPRLGVPSLRHSSGGIAYGLLRDDLLSMCPAAPYGAARPPPDEHLHSASRKGRVDQDQRQQRGGLTAGLSGWSVSLH
ncbi:hypothetical protein QFZ84_003916 [Pseudomonas fluorescens]